MVINTILVAIDLREPSTHLLDYARMIADASGAALHLLYVTGQPLTSTDAIKRDLRDARCRLDALLDDTDRERRHATVFCTAGPPSHEIIRYAADHSIDLIVMGTHCHGPGYHLPVGSIADAVLRLAPCAVLAVKSAQHTARS